MQRVTIDNGIIQNYEHYTRSRKNFQILATLIYIELLDVACIDYKSSTIMGAIVLKDEFIKKHDNTNKVVFSDLFSFLHIKLH